jgi:hypothetical protein
VRAAARGRALPPLAPIPLGWLRRPELPERPPAERPFVVSFLGSTGDAPGRRASLSWLSTPRARARRELLRRLARVELPQDIGLTSDFKASKQTGQNEYWQRLAAGRICLAPRGNSPETYRVFEAARAGCAVVCERLPPHWFYADAPFVERTGWRDLDRLLYRLAADPEALARRQRQTLDWWYERCSPEAVADRIATVLERVTGGTPGTRPSGG